jgi:hypothetical protein
MCIQDDVLRAAAAVPVGYEFHITQVQLYIAIGSSVYLTRKQVRDALYRLRDRHMVRHTGAGWYVSELVPHAGFCVCVSFPYLRMVLLPGDWRGTLPC